MSIPWSFSFKPSLCRSSVTSSLWISWGRLVQNRCWFSISSVVNGPIILSRFFRREFRMNLAVQATILNVLVRSNFPSITLRHPVDAMAPLKSSLVILASAWLSGVRLVMMSVGHFSLSESHSGPCHQSLPSSTSQVWRIFLGGYVAPSDPWMLLYFHRSVCYELFVLAAAVYPMESHWASQPSIAPLTGNPSTLRLWYGLLLYVPTTALIAEWSVPASLVEPLQ